MEIVLEPMLEQADSVWDDDVPIVKEGTTYSVYIYNSISQPDAYAKLCHLLRTAEPYEKINIYINTPGGVIDSAFAIIDSIKRSQATITAYCSGTVASAGTMIALSCDYLQIADFTQFMIHNYSGGTAGKGHEVRDYVKFSDAQLNKAFTSIYLGFITQDEIDSVIEGKDLWFDTDEVMERWERFKHVQDT